MTHQLKPLSSVFIHSCQAGNLERVWSLIMESSLVWAIGQPSQVGEAGNELLPDAQAPEMFEAGRLSEKIDQYAFAMLLWESHTGRLPWHNLTNPLQAGIHPARGIA